MLLHAIYDNGKVTFKEKKLPKIKVNIEVILPAMDAEKVVDLSSFSFKKAQKILKNYKGNLADAVIEERRASH